MASKAAAQAIATGREAEPTVESVAPLSCADLSPNCAECGGTGEKVRECPKCHQVAMRARLDHGAFSGLPIVGRKCDGCGFVAVPTYLRTLVDERPAMPVEPEVKGVRHA